MKLYALSTLQVRVISILWAALVLAAGTWAQSEERRILAVGGLQASPSQPSPVELKGHIFFVSPEQARQYLTSNHIAVGLILITVIFLLGYRYLLAPKSTL